MDILLSSDLINENVGHKIIMDLQRYGSQTVQKLQGIIRSAFSNDPTPDCKIETDTGIEEIFMGEVIDIQLLS